MTQRQGFAWDAWFRETLLTPDKGAYYLMQVAAEVRRGRAKDPNQVKVEDMLLRFIKEEGPKKRSLIPDQQDVPEENEPEGHGSQGSHKPTPSSQEQARDELPPGFPRKATKEDVVRMRKILKQWQGPQAGG